MKIKQLFRALGPGILVAATGVGAGDLATASFTGSALGLAILWAVVLGAFLKFVLNEGLTRWQLATGSTLLEGCVERLGRPVAWLFLAYLVTWSFFVAAALMGAVGVTCHAILPISGTGPDAARTDKVIYGILHSGVAIAMVRIGGYRLFETVMSICIGVMFVVVVVTAVALRPDVGDVCRGLVWPTIPAGGTAWTIALIGGVGGTLTVLCYGYWIREEGRQSAAELAICRVDLASGYLATALFGLSMVVIGSSLGEMTGGGATLVVDMAARLEATFGRFGPLARWAFLAGAWGAVFSSLLGVWQSVPYLFADLWRLMRRSEHEHDKVDTARYALPRIFVRDRHGADPGVGGRQFPRHATDLRRGGGAVRAAVGNRPAGSQRPGRMGRQGVQELLATVLVLVGTLLFFVYAGHRRVRRTACRQIAPVPPTQRYPTAREPTPWWYAKPPADVTSTGGFGDPSR